MKTKMTLKKILCMVLVFAIITVSIPLSAIASTADTVNFGILSDTHYFAKSAMGDTLADRNEFNEMMLLNNSTTGLAPALTDTALANLAIMAKKGEIDFLLLPGDLTRNAEYSAHKELTEKLAEFEEDTGIPVYVINGNHDINNQRSMYYDGEELVTSKNNPELREEIDTSPEEFEELYKEFGYSAENGYYSRYKEKADNSEGSLSYATDINDDYRLIAIDAQLYSSDNTDSGEDEQETGGRLSNALLDWAVNETKKAVKDGKTVIGLSHTNIIPHFETQVDVLDQFVFFNWEKAADALAEAGMHYVVSGHTHMQDVATHITDSGELITDIITTSILSYPNQFRTVTMDTYATGRIDCTYHTHDVDEVIPVFVNGIAQLKPFKYKTFAYNFGGDNIKNFVTNLLEYQLVYGFGKDVKDAGGLYKYLTGLLDFDEIMTNLIGSKLLGGVSSLAIKALLLSICNQLEDAYLTDVDATLQIVDPILDKLLAIEVADVPSTIYKDTLGFGSTGDKGTLGDLASTVLANHCANNENPRADKFLLSALERFDNGENAEIILDTLLEVVLDDLLLNTILEDIKIDPISLGINGFGGEHVENIVNDISNLLGVNAHVEIDLNDIISIVLILGVLDGHTLKDVVYGFLDEYLTESQYDIIDQEFYRIMKDFTHDENPGYMLDHEGTVSYKGKLPVPLTQKNLRLPSHIAVTFGEDASTERNISYYTKYSITDTDIQIVPYSKNPNFSRGTTVDVEIETKCDVETLREWPAIDLGFIGIIYHKENVNRHYINISGLEPDTKYSYRIGDAQKGWWSEAGVIDTADNSDSFSFFHMTDPQSTTEKQYNEVFAPAVELAFANHDADFILGTGDYVDDGRSFIQWQRMFNSITDTLMDTALMGAAGNHEEKGDYALANYFITPNTPEQDTLTGVYYSFDYNNAHFAVLNSNNLGEDDGLNAEQIEWLKADMNASDADWKFVAIHKAPYSNGSHFDDDDVMAIRNQFMGLMPELGIDVVFQGHDHVYVRSDVLNNNEVVETETKEISYDGLQYTAKVEPNGTIYSINGTIGVKHYQAKDESETEDAMPSGETAVYLEVPSYSYIQVDGDTLYFDSYAINGDEEERIDQFAIVKDLGHDSPVPDDNTNTPDRTDKPDTNKPITDNPEIPDTSAAGLNSLFVACALISSGFVATTIIRKKRKA